MDRINYFAPYESKGEWHEDQLTRAFLVILRLITLAQSAFLDLIREQMWKGGDGSTAFEPIPSFSMISSKAVDFRTQEAYLNTTSGNLISVIITDKTWVPSQDVRLTERQARYDGIVDFGQDFTIIIENKPWSENIWEDQLNPAFQSVTDPAQINIYPKPVVLLWRDAVSRLTGLLERGLIAGCEAMLVSDFLEFIDASFDYLNPYTSLRICKRSEYLLQRRCSQIMEQVKIGEVSHHRGWKDAIKIPDGIAQEVTLYPSPDERGTDFWIVLEMHPGDTVNQARRFFQNIDKAGFFRLLEQKWEIYPNMHFSFMATNLYWSESDIDLEQYFDYWHKNKESIGQIVRDQNGFGYYYTLLLKEGILTANDIRELEERTTNTGRQTINVCPGISLQYRWRLDEAIKIDYKDNFVKEVKARIGDAFSTWKQAIERINAR